MVKALEARNMEAYYVETKEEALTKALELIPEGASAAWGGTMSAQEIGLKQALCSGNYKALNRDEAKTPEEKRQIELATYDCDYFITSANAITEDGIIVNIDGLANRVSAIAYGPRNVLMIVGMNKESRRSRCSRNPGRHPAGIPSGYLCGKACHFDGKNGLRQGPDYPCLGRI